LNAIRALGDTLAKGHSDPWLADLTSTLGREDVPAVEALADAEKKNSLGDHSVAIKQSQVAAKLFLQRKNLAGGLRAGLEGVEAFRRMFDGSECLAHVDPLLNRLSTTSYHWMHAWALLEKAECGNLLGRFGEADADLQASRQIAASYGFPVLALRDVSLSAGNKHLRGNCDESWKESVDGLSVYWQEPGVPQSRLFQFYSVMLQCALEKGFLHEGEALLRQAILLLETGASGDSKNQKIDGTLHLQLANVLFARQANKEADEEMRKAAALVDPEKLPPQFDLIVKFEPAEFQLEHGNPRLALTALEPLRATLAHKPDKFFSLRFNQTLGRAFYKSGQLDQARSAYEAAIETAESSLGEIHNAGERLLWLRATDESYRGLVRVLIDQKKNREALDRWELYKSRPMLQEQFSDITGAANTGSRKPQPNPPASIYNSSEPRIIYASFDDGLCIWIVQGGNVASRWIDLGKVDFVNMSREFVEKCADENSKLSELNQLGTKLFVALLQPVISDVPSGKPVTIEQDQLAYNLPMEALQSPDGWYFGEKYSVVYSAGIRVEKTLRLPEPVSTTETFVLLDASRVKGAGYLPGFDTQAATITKLFPRTTVVDTTKTSLTESQRRIASSEIFHYMGHGKPNGSGTSLDYDGKHQLGAKDFNSGSLKHSQIAVLAACSGATGKENGLEDTNNLVRAFLAGGVPSIVASHWNVDSTSTSQLMTSFYRHLAKHESVAQAMYNARIEILHAKAHPYFWAGFALTGRAS
jgi:CHAT domain-containing protein